VSHRTRCSLLVSAVLVSALVGPVRAQFGKNKITYQHFDWQVYESPHFNIHYYPESEFFLEEIVSHAESAYLEVSRALDHELRFRVPLVIYRNHGEFEQTNIILSEVTEAVGAFAEPIQNRMVLPIDLPPDELFELLTHELVHIFQYSIFYEGYLGRALRSNPPLWLMEGMASYLAQDESNLDRMWIRDAVVNGTLPPIESLSVNTFLQYRWGHAIYDFIAEEYGPEGLRSFVFEYRKVLLTNNFEKAIQESFGYDLAEFNRAFARYLRRKYYPVLLEKKSPDDYGEEIGLDRPGLYTFSPSISPSGELIAALGTPRMELDLMVLSAEGGKKVKNLTKGYTNKYRYLVAEVFDGKRDVSWSPTADEVAVFARREDKWPLLVFDAVRGKRRHQIVFDDIVQCASPVFSPDGKRVAFEGNRNGVVDIFEVDLATREVRNLTQDDFFDANPWYAQDGSTVVYNRRVGSYWKIFTVDLEDPERKSQLTFERSSDIQPSLARDGSRIYFSSDRGEHGVFNIYSLDLSTAEVRQYTDVVGGCFAPVEMAEREGERNLVFSAILNGTFKLFRMPLEEPERTIPAEDRLGEPLEAEPFEPPLNLRVDESEKRKYGLKWDIDPPSIAVGVTDDGTFLADAAIGFSDLLGNHRARIVASSVDQYANFNVSYLNYKRRFNWGAAIYDYRDYYLIGTTDGNIRRDQTYRLSGADAFIQYPFSRHYRVDASVGVLDNSQDLLIGLDPGTGAPQFASFSDRFLSLNVGLTGDTTRYQSFGPFQGKRFHVRTWFAPHLSGDSDGDIIEHRLDFRAYKQLTRRSLIAFRASTIYNVGDRENYYGFGGINVLRGYDFREFLGSRLAWSNLEFRYPLVDSLNFPVFRLFQIRGLFFLDVGAAWFIDDLWWDPEVRTIRIDGQGAPIPFDLWNSELDEFQDARASYGAGFQFLLAGLQFNWIWARRLDYAEWDYGLQQFVKRDGGGTRQEFYIVFDF
jgi:Tol biopolymer transport system component